MHELQCPMCGIRFTGTCTNPSCEMNRRIADDMKHSANYNLVKMQNDEFRKMTDKKLNELYDRTKMRQSYPKICVDCGGNYDNTCFSAKCKAAREWQYTQGMTLGEEMKKREREEMMESLKDELYKDFKQREASDLKLYEVTVYVELPYPYKTATTHREIVVVLLAKDSTDAMSFAETSQGVTRMEDMAKSTWTEIQGPFKNGSVLSARNK